MNDNVLENVRKIAVLRANALGDYFFSLPALAALKSAYPQAELVYMGNPWHREFLSARPGPVDRVVVIPGRQGTHGELDRIPPHVAAGFFAGMRAESFDLAVQMHGGGHSSNPFMRKLGARMTVGPCADDAVPLDRNIPYSPFHNEVLRYLEVVRLAGASPVTVEPEIAVTDGDYHELEAALQDIRKPFAVIHPGASDERRRWPATKMAAIARALAARNIHVYVTGIPSEADVAEEVVRHAGFAAENICGALSLNAMTALLGEAGLLISNDTGPLHLARALGTPTVGIYWIGNVINAGPASARGQRNCVSWTTSCPKCGMDCIRFDAHKPRNGCAHDASFVDAVETHEVWKHIEALLAETDMPSQHRTVQADMR